MMHIARIIAVLSVSTARWSPARGDIRDWRTGDVIPGTEGVTLEPNGIVPFVSAPFADASGLDLHWSFFSNSDFSNAKFVATNFTNCDFNYTLVSGADFSHAQIEGAVFGNLTGFASVQLQSTASYANGKLIGLWLVGTDLINTDFSRMDLRYCLFQSNKLTGTRFVGSDLRWMQLTIDESSPYDSSGADFSLADLRHGSFDLPRPEQVILRNTILSDGTLASASLVSGDVLQIRNNMLGVIVTNGLILAHGSRLDIKLASLEASGSIWLNPIKILGAPARLGGTLQLDLDVSENPESYLGTIVQLFNWNGNLDQSTAFDSVAWNLPGGFSWDTSKLYTTGEVQLVPEVGAQCVGCTVFAVLLSSRRKRRSRSYN